MPGKWGGARRARPPLDPPMVMEKDYFLEMPSSCQNIYLGPTGKYGSDIRLVQLPWTGIHVQCVRANL